jgi:hypothetical protein
LTEKFSDNFLSVYWIGNCRPNCYPFFDRKFFYPRLVYNVYNYAQTMRQFNTSNHSWQNSRI